MDTTATFAAVQLVKPTDGQFGDDREIVSTGTFKVASFAWADFRAAVAAMVPGGPAVELVTIHGNRIAASYDPDSF